MRWLKNLCVCATAALMVLFCLKLPEIYCSYQLSRLTDKVDVMEMDAVELSMEKPQTGVAVGEDYVLTPLNDEKVRDSEQAQMWEERSRVILSVMMDSMGWDFGAQEKWEVQAAPYVATSSVLVEIFWRVRAAFPEISGEMILWLDENGFIRGFDLHGLEPETGKPLPTVEPTPIREQDERDYYYEVYTQEVHALANMLYTVYEGTLGYVEITLLEVDELGHCHFIFYTDQYAYEGELSSSAFVLNPQGLNLAGVQVTPENEAYDAKEKSEAMDKG